MALRAIFIALIFALLSFDAFAQVGQTSTQAAATSETAGYTLGPGDQLRIIVYGEVDLTGDFAILPNGNLAFPLIGEVTARGLTATQLGGELERRLQEGYVRAPRVSVSISQYRPFYILGEVANPGTYPYSADISVMSAVATAGGFTYRANRRRVYIRRAGSNEEQMFELNGETRVMPGDTLRIGERFF
ncbi:MAG: polysaccharide biosynthesis/export family protein [Phycisphaerales bacterium]|nr:polysaccharide biosynthesis/export family protein [Hyphomonadaceae bacterium]